MSRGAGRRQIWRWEFKGHDVHEHHGLAFSLGVGAVDRRAGSGLINPKGMMPDGSGVSLVVIVPLPVKLLRLRPLMMSPVTLPVRVIEGLVAPLNIPVPPVTSKLKVPDEVTPPTSNATGIDKSPNRVPPANVMVYGETPAV